MSRAGKDADRRVKTGRGRTASSVRWLERQLNDPYVKQAKAEGYRSRAAYKLTELDERFGLVRGAKRVVDLGIAPGGWSQVVRKRAPKATIVGIDLLKKHFRTVKHAKPPASRKGSSEWYVVAQGFKGR